MLSHAKKYRSIGIFGLVMAVVPLLIAGQYYQHMLVSVLLYAFLAVSWNMMAGTTGYFSLGNGVWISIGGYVTGALFQEDYISPWLGLLLGAISAGLLSMLINYPCFRLRGSYYTLATVALLGAFRQIILGNEVILGHTLSGTQGFKIAWRGGFANMQFQDKLPYYYIILIFLLLALLASAIIKNSRSGYYYASIATNEEAASSLGVPIMRYKLRAQFTSAFFSALGGGFYCMFYMFMDANRIAGATFSTEIMLMGVVGGMGSIWGPVAGTLILQPLNELLRASLGTTLSGLPTLLYGVILMIVVYFIPTGIFPPIARFFKRIREKHVKKPSRSDGGAE